MSLPEINSFNVGDGVGYVGMPDEDGRLTVRGLGGEKWEWEKEDEETKLSKGGQYWVKEWVP